MLFDVKHSFSIFWPLTTSTTTTQKTRNSTKVNRLTLPLRFVLSLFQTIISQFGLITYQVKTFFSMVNNVRVDAWRFKTRGPCAARKNDAPPNVERSRYSVK